MNTPSPREPRLNDARRPNDRTERLGRAWIPKEENRRYSSMRIERILLPVSFSVRTVDMLRYATELAAEFGASVHLLHVVRPELADQGCCVPSAIQVRESVGRARKTLAKLVEILWGGEIVATVCVRQGTPDEIILQEARDLLVYLILIGTRGSRGWLRRLQPNTDELVVRSALCPVLVVPISGRGAMTSPGFASSAPFEAATGLQMTRMTS